jgi:hypothetical protein
MSLAARDRRALTYLGVAVILAALYMFWPTGGTGDAVSASTDSVETAEKRLARLREIAASVPAKEDVLKKVSADLETREQGLIRAATGAQAQAQLVSLLRRLGDQEAPALEVRQTELGGITPLGEYGLATVTVQFDCRIEQLVNFLASLAAQPELIVTRDLQVNASNAKQKTVRVRLTVAGVVPKDLVPAKKG